MDSERLDRLSERQKQCLRLVRGGYTTKEIADTLSTSPNAIDKSIKLAMAKIGVDRRSLAARALAVHESGDGAGTGYQQLGPPPPDLPDMLAGRNIGGSPRHEAIAPVVQEERAIFEAVLDPPGRPVPPDNRKGESGGRGLGDTVSGVFDRVARLAGVIFMVLALAYLASVTAHRWEIAHHARPR